MENLNDMNMDNNIKRFSDYNKEGGQQNYMFFKNIQNIKRMVDQICEMDENEVDQILTEHDWASDHVTVATENIDQVYHFLFAENNEE